MGIFRLPSGKDEKSKQTCDEWIKVITRDRVVDANFRKIIEAGNVYVCEKHFKKEEIECREYYIFFFTVNFHLVRTLSDMMIK